MFSLLLLLLLLLRPLPSVYRRRRRSSRWVLATSGGRQGYALTPGGVR